MNPGSRLGAYGVLLAAMLGGGAALGAATGPVDVGRSSSRQDTSSSDADRAPSADLPAGGLVMAHDGYTFAPEDLLADPGPFAFTITGPDREPVESYDVIGDRELHLVVASRDLRQYARLHPARDEDGRWSVELPSLPAGAYRAFAEFQPAGAQQYTLGVDLTAEGTVDAPSRLVPRSTDAVAGYDVMLEQRSNGASTEITVTVRRNGEVVATEPSSGAAGHLVALRYGDMAYLRVHPLEDGPSGAARFAVEIPTAGTYALFFDFRVDGVARTASFVIHAAAPSADAAEHGDDADHADGNDADHAEGHDNGNDDH